jgi:hypothetical protein
MAKRNGGIIGPDNVPAGPLGAAKGVWRIEDAFNYQKAGLWPTVLGYQIPNSLRFNSGSSDYLNKTSFGTATNRKIFTFSFWVKKTTNGDQMIFSAGTNSSTNVDQIYFRYPTDITENTFDVVFYESSVTKLQLRTTQYFRDPSAWYHFVVAIDSTQATASNRAKVYLNGTEITSFSTATYPSLNDEFLINSTGAHYIGGSLGAAVLLNGYLSEFNFIDGQQLTPSSFGQTDSATGIWTPLPYTGTFGINGFYLKFANSAALGTDSSGNGNTFTVNNLTSVDQSTDTPTNNFATFNSVGDGSSVTLAEGNLLTGDDGSTHTSQKGIFISTIGVSKGKWYAEFKFNDTDCIVGIATTSKDYVGLAEYYLGQGTGEYGLDSSGTPTIYTNGSGTTYGSGSTASGDIVSVALDLDNNKLYFAKNGTYYNSGNPATNTNGHSITAGEYYIAGGHGNLSALYGNFGSPPYSVTGGYTDANGFGNFSYAVPSGYYSLCSKNLAIYG